MRRGSFRRDHGAAEARTDQDRFRLLLAQLAGVPEDWRRARFHCVVALVWPDGQVHTVDGVCEGRIGLEPRGSHGFGYDPIFLVAEAGYAQTMAESILRTKTRSATAAAPPKPLNACFGIPLTSKTLTRFPPPLQLASCNLLPSPAALRQKLLHRRRRFLRRFEHDHMTDPGNKHQASVG